MKKISVLLAIAIISLLLTACKSNVTTADTSTAQTAEPTVTASTAVPTTTTTAQPTTTTVTTTSPATTVTTTTPENTITTFDTTWYKYDETKKMTALYSGELYAAPDKNSEILYNFEKNSEFEVYGCANDDWLAVYIDNRIVFAEKFKFTLTTTVYTTTVFATEAPPAPPEPME